MRSDFSLNNKERAVLNDPKFSCKFKNLKKFVNYKEAFFQTISKTPQATEGPEIWNRYFHFFLTISKLV